MDLEAATSTHVAPRGQLGRPSKRTTSVEAVIAVGRTTSSLAREIADVCQFPPARAAAGLLVLIFETIEGMRKNQERCVRLAERAATIFIDVHEQMQGRWLDAPEPLVQNLKKFEETLRSIHEFMLEEAGAKWKDRLLRKKNIDEAIHDYTMLLNDAARTFQIAALIDIHCALQDIVEIPIADDTLVSSPTEAGDHSRRVKELFPEPPASRIFAPTMKTRLSFETESSTQTICEDEKTNHKATLDGHSFHEKYEETSIPDAPLRQASTSTSSNSPVSQYCTVALLSMPSSEVDHKLPRFHQSQVRLQPRAVKVPAGSWHAGAVAVRVSIPGVPPSATVYMKRYDGPKVLERWTADTQMLSSSTNPFMPVLVGVSDEKTPVRFLLLVDRSQ